MVTEYTITANHNVEAEDKNALAKLSVSNNHASYLNTHGLAPEFKRQLTEKLKKVTFSMNVDEATNLKTDKVLNVLDTWLILTQSAPD